MSVLRTIWSEEKGAGRRVILASSVAAAAGMALIVIGIIAGWGPTRLPGALLITMGGAAGGAALGFSRPVRTQIWSRLMRARVWIAFVSAVIIATPAILAMASATIGPMAGGGDANDKLLVMTGALLGLIFMIATVLAALVAVQATRARVTQTTQQDQDAGSREDRA